MNTGSCAHGEILANRVRKDPTMHTAARVDTYTVCSRSLPPNPAFDHTLAHQESHNYQQEVRDACLVRSLQRACTGSLGWLQHQLQLVLHDVPAAAVSTQTPIRVLSADDCCLLSHTLLIFRTRILCHSCAWCLVRLQQQPRVQQSIWIQGLGFRGLGTACWWQWQQHQPASTQQQQQPG